MIKWNPDLCTINQFKISKNFLSHAFIVELQHWTQILFVRRDFFWGRERKLQFLTINNTKYQLFRGKGEISLLRGNVPLRASPWNQHCVYFKNKILFKISGVFVVFGFKTVWYIKYFSTLQVVNRAFCFYTFFSRM